MDRNELTVHRLSHGTEFQTDGLIAYVKCTARLTDGTVLLTFSEIEKMAELVKEAYEARYRDKIKELGISY